MVEKKIKVKIKPLSINQAWQGRRFKSRSYIKYERDLLLLLPSIEIPQGEMSIDFVIGYSNKLSDIDNFLKPFQDILQKKYSFNDNRIYKITIEKEIVKKGEEFISFQVCKYTKQSP
jgi:Holliday junction resolvase RusA-like endonuclease